MIDLLILLAAVLTLTASTYLSYACFCIVHRMNHLTPWSTAIAIAMIASLAAYAFLQSIAYLLGELPYVPPALAFASIFCAAIFLALPRIDTERALWHL